MVGKSTQAQKMIHMLGASERNVESYRTYGETLREARNNADELFSEPVRGVSTIELLIAFAILTLTLTAIVSLVFGNLSVTVDARMSDEALALAASEMETARALAQSDFLAASSTSRMESFTGTAYTLRMDVEDLTPCKKKAVSNVLWSQGALRPLSLSLDTTLSDVTEARKLGGDCPTQEPTEGWRNFERFASDSASQGTPRALDVLNRTAYIATNAAPYLVMARTQHATQGQTSGLFFSYANGFEGSARINALDAISWRDPATGSTRVYVFAALHSSTAQLEVYDVTDPFAPVRVHSQKLSPCVTGSFPQGWFIQAYGERLYLTTRETAGPELHVFDISVPATPVELAVGSVTCKGFQLGDTVEQFVVRNQIETGTVRRYLYAATNESDKEIRVLDVTNPFSITEATSVDLPGNNDGASVFLLGTRLYFGRLTSTGNDLYIFDASRPSAGLAPLGGADIGASVLGMRVLGQYAYLITSSVGREIQAWHVKDAQNMSRVETHSSRATPGLGIDYEDGYVFVIGDAPVHLELLHFL